MQDRFVETARKVRMGELPPVEDWNPPFCGAIDMRIAADGRWFYQGSEIMRPAMVRLFSTVLRKDPDGFMLVTPVEKVAITVDDAPFVTSDMRESAEGTVFVLNTGEKIHHGEGHGLRFAFDATGGFKPYLHVRGGLEARLSRDLAIVLGERIEETAEGGMVLALDGQHYPIPCEDAPESPAPPPSGRGTAA